MFGAKQVQTLDVAAIMDRIMENHDSKVKIDNLKVYLDKAIHDKAVELSDDAEIRKDAERGYSWNYKAPLEQITVSVKELMNVIGYEVSVEDAQIFYECNEKYSKYYAESHKKEEE